MTKYQVYYNDTYDGEYSSLVDIAEEYEFYLESYNEMLEEIYGDTINICGYEYSTAFVWKDTDPTAWRCGYLDYIDSRVRDWNFIEDDNGDDIFEIDGYTIVQLN